MIEIIVAIVEFFLILSASFGISSFVLKKELIDSTLEYIIFRIFIGLGIISYLTFFAAVLGFINFLFFIIVILTGNAILFLKKKAFLP